jgi:hypothetical protein
MGPGAEPDRVSIEPAASAAASAVLMIRPSAFGCNEVTRPTNPYQSSARVKDPDRIAALALREFDLLVEALQQAGIEVNVFSGRTTTPLPDEVFPNNWISTHPDGTVILYPMMAWNRRQERRRDVLATLQQQTNGYRMDRLIDLSDLEQKDSFLEGTGSMVFDHGSRLAYACFSPRTHAAALREFGRATDYGIITFDAKDRSGRAIYHTNVMMSLGEKFAVVCLDAIESVNERFRLITRLEKSGREVIELSMDQLSMFCGNILQLRSREKRFIFMSRQARIGLKDRQIESLQRHGEFVIADVSSIERVGGGSVRCMLAELLLPRKDPAVGAASAQS